MFQSIAGTEKANTGFGINLALLQEGYEATLSLQRGTVGQNVMYFETGQGSALSSNGHHGVNSRPWKHVLTPWRVSLIPCWSIPWSALSGRNICIMASRLSGPGWKIISVASCSVYQWAVIFATPIMPMPIRMIWMYC